MTTKKLEISENLGVVEKFDNNSGDLTKKILEVLDNAFINILSGTIIEINNEIFYLDKNGKTLVKVKNKNNKIVKILEEYNKVVL